MRCEINCTLVNDGFVSSYMSRVKMARNLTSSRNGNGLYTENNWVYFPDTCRQCEDPACGNACPQKAITTNEQGIRVVDTDKCIGCGACAATCKNGSAMLFVAARVSSLAKLPQGRVEGARRAKAMVAKMDELGFGNCTNTGACQAECPKSISIAHIARLNREFLSAKFED